MNSGHAQIEIKLNLNSYKLINKCLAHIKGSCLKSVIQRKERFMGKILESTENKRDYSDTPETR